MPRAKQFDEAETLEKAVLLFWKQGYHHTSVQDLVDHLGLNRGSLYNTFGGKRALFDRAFAWYRHQEVKRLRTFLEAQPNVRTGLRALFGHLIEDDCADPDAKGCFIVNTTTELIPSDPDIQQVLVHHRNAIHALLHDALTRGLQQKQIAEEIDVDAMAQLLYTLMTGLRVVGKTKPDPARLHAMLDTTFVLLE
ncbi:MAG: TetR/AcrR family transcriptional regulator [Bacteroidota bacterium]